MESRVRAVKAVLTIVMICAMSALLAPGMRAQPTSPVASAPTPINWRHVESFRAARFESAVELSSERTLRLTSVIDNEKLVSPELSVDSVRDWNTRIFTQLDNPTKREYVLGNAILVQPFIGDGGHIGFLLTVADTLGASRQVIIDKGGLESFLDMLETGVVAGRTLTDADLRKAGPVLATPVSLAKPYTAVYPRTARLANVSGSALLQFVVDTSGKVRRETINCIEATYKDFSDAAQSSVLEMEFTPATIDGHKIERMVQIPFNFSLHNDLPITPFQVPVVLTGRRR